MEFNMNPQEYDNSMRNPYWQEIRYLKLEDERRFIPINKRKIAELEKKSSEFETKRSEYKEAFEDALKKKIPVLENNPLLNEMVKSHCKNLEFKADSPEAKYVKCVVGVTIGRTGYSNRTFKSLGYRDLNALEHEAFVRAYINVATRFIKSNYKNIHNIESSLSYIEVRDPEGASIDYSRIAVSIKCVRENTERVASKPLKGW